MNVHIDGDRIEQGAKVATALAALFALVWKICRPVCKWLRQQIQMGDRIEALTNIISRELQPNGTPIRDKIAEIQTHIRVLTAREQLRFENSPIPSYECDSHGLCIAVNPAWCNLFGVEEAHMMGNGWLDVIEPGTERDRVMANWLNCVTNRLPHRERYRAVNRTTGDVVWCESSTVTYEDKDGNPVMYFGTIKRRGKDWAAS